MGSSDVAMVVQTLRIMCGDEIVNYWQDLVRLEEERGRPSSRTVSIKEDDLHEEEDEEQRAKRLQDEEEANKEREAKEEVAKEASRNLVVFFVIEPGKSDGERKKKKTLADTVVNLCKFSGANCLILPSPDVLVGALATYANKGEERKVTERHVRDEPEGLTRLATCESATRKLGKFPT